MNWKDVWREASAGWWDKSRSEKVGFVIFGPGLAFAAVILLAMYGPSIT